MAKAAVKYDKDSITRLQGLDGVRRRPDVYVGGKDSNAILHLCKEVLGNCIDEAANGHGLIIATDLAKDGTVTIFDQGRGIPTGKHKSDGKTDTLEIIMTELHTGGKLDENSKNYSAGSIGLNGMGLAVVNALSVKMQVWSNNSGKWMTQSYAKGKATSSVVAGKPPKFKDKTWPKGTVVQFKPDLSVMDDGAKLTPKMLVEWIKNISWFVYGKNSKPISFALNLHTPKGVKSATIRRESLADYAYFVVDSKELTPIDENIEPFVYSDSHCDILLYPTTSSNMIMRSSVSSVQTINDGTHVVLFKKLLSAALEEIKPKRMKFSVDDFLTGFVSVVNVKLTDAAYAGQAKERLTYKLDKQLNGFPPMFRKWARQNGALMKTLYERAVNISSANSSFAMDKKLAAALGTNAKARSALPLKLERAATKNRDERELYIIEGDSAKGTAVKDSDRRYQEILPLRGKILNVVRKEDKQSSSTAVLDILKSIGFDPRQDFEKTRRYNKVFLLTDADDDGAHIDVLLLGLLFKTMPSLFKEGRVYDVRAPLFTYNTKDQKLYANKLDELRKLLGAKFDAKNVVRMKGWGEASAGQLTDIVFNPATRSVARITVDDAAKAAKAVQEILGDESVEIRRQLLGIGQNGQK